MVLDDTEENIVYAEVVEDVSNGSKDVIINLEALIKTQTIAIDKTREKLKEQKQMLEDAFQNDPTYIEHEKLAKEAAKVKGKTKSEITKQPAVSILSQKVKDLSLDLKDKQASVSDYLKEYQRLTQVTEIEVEVGDVREIVNVPKLVKKKTS